MLIDFYDEDLDGMLNMKEFFVCASYWNGQRVKMPEFW